MSTGEEKAALSKGRTEGDWKKGTLPYMERGKLLYETRRHGCGRLD